MLSGPHPNLIEDHEPAETLVRDLERVDQMPQPWGPFSSAILGFFSLGVIPALLWHDRFRGFVDNERLHLRRFAEWLRAHSSRPETIDLRVAGEDIGCRPLLSTLSILSTLGVIMLFAAHLGDAFANGVVIDQLQAWTYHFRRPHTWHPPASLAQKLHFVWAFGLSIAYLFHWLQVQGHRSDIRRFVAQANRVLASSGARPVPSPAGLHLNFWWIVVGALLVGRGAWWGIPLALSGAAQQHYMRSESARIRRALASRLREIARMPAAANESAGTRRCPHVRCLAPMPAGARFCPRCGHNVSPMTISV